MATHPNYKQELAPVIAASWFTLDPGTYVYTSAEKVNDPEKHLLVVRDGIEITVVTDISNLPMEGNYKENKERWKLLNIRCGSPFYCVGFIAYITDTLAVAGIDIVITSSFSNDLILVMDKDLERAIMLLKEAGFGHRSE
ncbi:ACT domain-containing protein [Ferruginibacter sp. HRS2-29]|uniref:ACT domain-containing protein n=1 Tax=Ferruginibacter sp. HRS2-29 TaxID=2487334 RepID=UPI0020CFB11F|nr:ACT domain-containing protein [Ferruginibacter sp. HRS2-29]MCP9749686.1 ACT domain-containing protein [Ferruginibacter sp. HRS2-29]